LVGCRSKTPTLIAQENDKLKQEVEKLKRDLYVLKEESQVQPSQDNHDDMVKKLEKGSTITSSTPQQHIKIIKGNIQEKKKDMALHIAPPRSRLKKQSPRRKEDQLEGDCVIYAKRRVTRLRMAHRRAALTRGCLAAPRAVRPGLASTMKNHRSEENKVHPSSKKPPCKPRQDKQMDHKPRSAKGRNCYTCREKGHLGKDCPNGNTPHSNLGHYDFHKLRNDKVDTCTMRLIGSPQVSTRAIWIPKHIVTNLVGPNKVWVPKSAC
jgi:hypothetical protein